VGKDPIAWNGQAAVKVKIINNVIKIINLYIDFLKEIEYIIIIGLILIVYL
jgi:hypothetical protein